MKKSFLFLLIFLISSCVSNNVVKKNDKVYYSSKGFALIYDDNIFKLGGVNKKFNNNDEVLIMHNFLKRNTPIKIINPVNSKFLDVKVTKNAKYSKLFHIVISKKTAEILNLDIENPYVEIFEVKKNKTFIAKEGNIFDEEKNVAETAPVDEVKIDDLSKVKKVNKKIKLLKKSFIIVISDFYYFNSATNLKNELLKNTKFNNFYIEKINDKKYRLSAGPFKNFNSLKSIYISLNNLGFESLNIYKK